MKFRLSLILLIFLPFVLVFSQEENKCHKSTEGTDFWFGFMESRNYHNDHYLEITVTARESTNFNIYTGPNETQLNNQYTVAANQSIQIRIPWELVEATGSETIQDRGIHLVSEKPVNVYALNWDSNSADVAVIYPTESLGNEYFAMCYEPHIHENSGKYGNGRNSEFLIVAIEDSTVIDIVPSVVTDSLKPADSLFTVMLNKGQVYQVQSMNFNNLPGQGDLTGSYILTDKPIAFYSGSLATTVPRTSNSAWDHLYEQIPPVQTWGKEFYAVPLKSREQDLYRVMASQDNTTISIEGKSQITLDRGEFEEFILYHNQPSKILADKPILVVQFSQSKSVDDRYTGGNGDPFMIILSPTSQSKNDVTFVAYDSNQIRRYFVNIVTLTEETNNIVFSGGNIQNQWKTFSDKKYSYAQIEINSDEYRIYNTNPDRGFLAYVYGFGGVESYGYGVGFNLNLVLDIRSSINFNGDTLLLCHGDTKTLDAGPYFDIYAWDTGETTQKLDVTEGGKYAVTTSTIDGCILRDSIFVEVKHPQTNIGIDTAFCFPEKIELDAGEGFSKYYWQNGDTVQKIIADKTDSYSVTVHDAFGCPARDTMNLTVYPLPKVKIIGDSLICGAYTSSLELEITDAPEEVWNYNGSIKWASDKPTLLEFDERSTTLVEISVKDWGEYKVSMELTTTDGCIVIEEFNLSFHPSPTSTYRFIEDSPEEKCSGYSREVLYDGNATENATFYWDFEGSKIVDSLGWQNFRISLGAFTIPSISLYVEENGCWSDDTTKMLIGAHPDFKLLTEKSRGCDSITINFRGELKVEDALLFEWEFGDGSPINNQQNPSNFYDEPGFYDVGLTITNILTECKIGFTIDSMIKVFQTPTAEFTADPTQCYTDSFDVQYLNYINSSICYWDYDDCHNLVDENQKIRVQIDEPTATLTLRVNEFGCMSEPVSKNIKRKPHFNFFTEKEEGCQPYTLEIIAEPLDSFLKFTWIKDTLSDVNAPSIIYTLPDSGYFSTLLQSYSTETGCIDSLFKTNWIWVHPKPIADFEVDYPVATIKHGDIQFTNKSLYGIYHSWDFGDSQSSDVKNPQHTYEEIGEFYPQLITETEFGCLDTTDMLIQVFPFSVFTPNAFRPDSEIPENRKFMPLGTGADPNRFHIMIFDRWGQVVFESNSFEHKWDGKTKNGKNAPTGNYIWKADFFDIQGFEHHQNGQVILIR